ncbi:MAG: hypothetical protein JXQ96_15665 [Cyclobacteriaceae bacterium]
MAKGFSRILRKTIKATFFLMILGTNLCMSQVKGLGFHSHEVAYEKRTSMNLSPDGYFKFRSEFRMTFDLNIEDNKNQMFGYVFRMIVNDTLNIDFLIKREPPFVRVLVIHGDSPSNIVVQYPVNALFGSWRHFDLQFSLNQNKITLKTDTTELKNNVLNIHKNDRIKLLFGANQYLDYTTTDLPPVNLRELKIYEDNRLIHYWPLNEGNGNIAYDNVGNKDARLTNPKWLATKHQFWTLDRSFSLSGIAMTAYNKEENLIYLVGNDSLATVNMDQNSYYFTSYDTTNFSFKPGDQSIYSNNNELYVYDISQGGKLNKYNILENRWVGDYAGKTPLTEYWHHNRFIDEQENKLFLVGGYGQHTYKNTVYTYDDAVKKWYELMPGQENFSPRSLAGLAINKTADSAYIFGGYGSRKGSQMLSPKFYNDINLYLPKQKSLQKIGELEISDNGYCFANSVVMDSSRNFYGLLHEKNKFNSYLKLAKWSLKNTKPEFLADSIPYSFHDIRSYSDLYYSPTSEKLYTVTTLYDEEKKTTDVNIYSLNFPPINLITQQESSNHWLPITAAISLLFGLGLFIKLRSRKEETPTEKVVEQAPPAILPKQKKQNCILLFGGFQVFDKNGDEITGKITPLQKELFLMVLMTSLRHEKGISSERLDEIFWFDKSKVKARNNRSVNISKINAVFQELGGCNFNLRNGSWMVDIDHEKVYVDYSECLQLIEQPEISTQSIKRLTELVHGGALLLNSNYEWLDEYKGDVSNRVIDVLLKHIKDPDIQKDQNSVVNLTNMVFTFDPTNEDALNLQCQAFVKLGKHSLAEKTYNRFAKEYKVIYAEDYEFSMSEVIKGKSA